ncbi:hypothetical protein ACH4LN_17960 [Streptomyces albus]|uniref:hypothetical protein n=1 Tax=Streptomyces TaxID=1883 RepID=UPI00034E0A1E|nr:MULTISPECIES: hypothetical protein [Streptomyces]EPD94579.1 hypothetical protein HMPREF1486_03132 [Streptomyces sp. HPH0547]
MRPAAWVSVVLAGLLALMVPGFVPAVVAALVWSVQQPWLVAAGLAVAVARLLLVPAPRGWGR